MDSQSNFQPDVELFVSAASRFRSPADAHEILKQGSDTFQKSKPEEASADAKARARDSNAHQVFASNERGHASFYPSPSAMKTSTRTAADD